MKRAATSTHFERSIPHALLYRLDAAGIAPVAYEETEHYQLTRRFLENPKGMLRILLEED